MILLNLVSGKGGYQCPYCLKRFDVRYSLLRHIRVIHDPERHLYDCNGCGRRFAWKSAFLRHVNITCVNRGRRQTN
ncbi:zinc finger and BTB domain-containing protein 22-like protein [Dinothrombium tinctorium]|uniref:Zinc finger and BTB domain-containing protein 22-like protein n=1 Tax=Dinothrombium tinctorium TaxID=1965070 RepID=A0A3S3PBB3_9ACAR|nr:zinc finger and BTB domain-containing protein 22-like protein [Dinothrombium tinctorium]RWS05042.1 zinc finger and BTB domain-containing protein 22-like protein [Dinothrombium tinctorium]RWS05790.1 zinc finger and BTB domain-containing protein 22-like protein [Dinothrombium tinctorium]